MVLISYNYNGVVLVKDAISKSVMRNIERINEDGPYIGIVVPNAFEMHSLIYSPSFVAHPDFSYLDFSGRRFRIGRVENVKAIIVMTGLSMVIKLAGCVNTTTCLPRRPIATRPQNGINAKVFVDNAVYREFLNSRFNATVIDMESAAVALVCQQHRITYIAIRSLSGGDSSSSNEASMFISLAVDNAVTVVIKLVSLLSS